MSHLFGLPASVVRFRLIALGMALAPMQACIEADGIVSTACVAPALSSDEPVVVAAGQFLLHGEPILPQGVGSYPLLEHAGNGRIDAMRDIFRQARALGRPIVRTNAFMDGGSNPGRIRAVDGTIRAEGLAALDLLLDEARRAGVRLLLVLTNNWRDYGGAPAVLNAVAPNEDLPKDAFWSDPRAVRAQAEYIDILLSRVNALNGVPYSEDPTVFAWELANEARCDSSAYCADDTLVQWAQRMGASVRDAGARQLVAWGGAGYADYHGERLEQIAESGAVDVITLHVYGMIGASVFASSPESAIAASLARGLERIAMAVEISRRTGVPLIVEEFGYRPDALDADGERAYVYRAWLEAARRAGVATFPWMIGEEGRIDYDGFLVRPDDDKVWSVLRCDP